MSWVDVRQEGKQKCSWCGHCHSALQSAHCLPSYVLEMRELIRVGLLRKSQSLDRQRAELSDCWVISLFLTHPVHSSFIYPTVIADWSLSWYSFFQNSTLTHSMAVSWAHSAPSRFIMLPTNKLPANKPPSNSHFSFRLKIIKFMHELLISVTGHWNILGRCNKAVIRRAC